VNLSQKVAFNTTVLLASRVVVAASGLAGVAVSTRYLGPAEFGQLTVAIVFVSVFGFFTDAGLYTVAARELAKHPEDERRLLANVFSMGLVLTAATVVVALLVMAVVYGGSGDDLVRTGVVILVVQMLASPLGGAASAYLIAHQRAGPMAFAATFSSLVFIGGLFAVIELDLGFAGLAACFAASGVISLLLPFAVVRGVRLRWARDPAVWRQMLRWAIPQAGVLVLSVIYFRLDTFLLSFLSSDAEVGLYGVAYRVLEVLIVVPVYLMTTLFPEVARQRPHAARLNEIVQGAFSSVVLAGVPLVIIFAAFAEEIVAVAGGPRYADASPVLRVLVVAVAILFVNTVFFQSLVALNRQRNLFMLLLAVLVGNVALNLVLIPPLGAMGAALALVATEAAALGLVLRTFVGVGTVPRLRRPARLICAALGTAAVVLALREVIPLVRPDEMSSASFTAAIGPLATLGGASVLTVGLWAGSLMLLDAVPPELRAALAALRQRSSSEPVAVPPPVGG
jgi:O-antigen/teichoic acid export membrane protein